MKQDKNEFKALVDLLSDIFDIEEKEVEKHLTKYGISSLSQFFISFEDLSNDIAFQLDDEALIDVVRTEALIELLSEIFSMSSKVVADFLDNYGISNFTQFERDLKNRIKSLSN